MAINDESVFQTAGDGARGSQPTSVEEGSTERAAEHRSNQTRSRQIPWGYGRDRVTAMAVDPDRLFVYWEVLDESLERARAQLGDESANARLALRVYDTTGRLFDGRNAHSHFDQTIQRSDRQWFCNVGKPSSSAHVEVGMLAPSGWFQRVARSGRVDFPRREPAAAGPVEWMSVRPGGGEPDSHFSFPITSGESRDDETGWENGSPSPAARGEREITAGEWLQVSRVEQVERVERVEHEQILSEVWATGQFETLHREEWLSGPILLPETRWQTAAIETAWEAGPFPCPVEVEPPSREEFVEAPRTFREGQEVRVLHGPWQVIVRGLGAHTGHRVLARWEIHRTYTRVEHAGPKPGAGEWRRPGGASELYALAASELRLRGASELFYLGASERRLAGASELRFMGATHFRARGASERRFAGASERRLGGASERRLGGASERLSRAGASEGRLGGSEARLGGSEGRLAGAQHEFADLPPINGAAK